MTQAGTPRDGGVPPGAGEQPLPARPLAGGRAGRRPPPRPATTSAVALPLTPPEARRPGAVRLAAVLWWAGCLAATVGLVAMLLDRAALDARLTATATAEDPTASAALVADGVRTLVAGIAGAVGLLVLVSLVWVALVLRRRSWARWALLVTLLPLLLALDVAQSVAAGDADLDRVALVAAAGLFVVAVVPLFLRSARAWSRAR
ncbi:hypothetical protein SAMN04488107_3745 [Geodermatophilus saharensis]|uniref:Uncharacterized protein n=1 Tax=Geodermatophilus saharensis TaxID=1137994 RepID=A0A239HBT3_9ACTN|nr:hypothetical protein SAMN04488107_3745 [Geodermatophilus saharensis]